jgi:hypothetical protein
MKRLMVIIRKGGTMMQSIVIDLTTAMWIILIAYVGITAVLIVMEIVWPEPDPRRQNANEDYS